MTGRLAQLIQKLLDRPRGRGMVVSVYADLSSARSPSPSWRADFESACVGPRKRFENQERLARELEENLDAARRVLEKTAVEPVVPRGLAVFSDAEHGFLATETSGRPFPPQVVVGDEAYLPPLVAGGLEDHRVLVGLVDESRARVDRSTEAGVEVLREIEGIPGSWTSSVPSHVEELARALVGVWDSSPLEGLVLIGPSGPLQSLRALLPVTLARRLIQEAPRAALPGPAEVGGVVSSALASRRAERESRILEVASAQLELGSGASTGAADVVDALQEGRVSSLIIGPDDGSSVSRCDRCGSIFAPERPTCPYCVAPCHRSNRWQELVGLALGQGVEVCLAHGSDWLARHGNVAVLLGTAAEVREASARG